MAANFSTAFNSKGSSSSDFLADWVEALRYKSSADYGLGSGGAQSAQPSAYTPPSVSALPSDYADRIKAEVELQKQLQPLYLEQAKAAAKFGADATRQQMIDQFPILSAASSQSKFLNKQLSTEFLLDKERTPTAQALRNQIASGQIASAQAGEAELGRAIGAQYLAAAQGPAKYSGSTFRMT